MHVFLCVEARLGHKARARPTRRAPPRPRQPHYCGPAGPPASTTTIMIAFVALFTMSTADSGLRDHPVAAVLPPRYLDGGAWTASTLPPPSSDGGSFSDGGGAGD